MTLEEKIQEFSDYRKAIKKPLKPASFEAFMRRLIKLGNGNEETMIEILEVSIANGWQGIFPLKNGTNIDNFQSLMDRVLNQRQIEFNNLQNGNNENRLIG